MAYSYIIYRFCHINPSNAKAAFVQSIWTQKISESYPMNTKMTGFRWFSNIFVSLCTSTERFELTTNCTHYLYNKTNMTSQHGQHGKSAAQALHCQSEFRKVQLLMDFGCGWGLFGTIKHALWWQCSLGEDNYGTHPTGMSCLYIIAYTAPFQLLCQWERLHPWPQHNQWDPERHGNMS